VQCSDDVLIASPCLLKRPGYRLADRRRRNAEVTTGGCEAASFRCANENV
jgi:hypothetical protein